MITEIIGIEMFGSLNILIKLKKIKQNLFFVVILKIYISFRLKFLNVTIKNK